MLALPSTFSHLQASNHAAWQVDARASQWQIDCAALQHFDSSVLALLLDLRRAARAENQTITLLNAPAKLTQLATLYGVNELLVELSA
jgi:phospholipid transport system transporter-binding protein